MIDPKALQRWATDGGFEFKMFCSFDCGDEAVGDIGVRMDDSEEIVMLPICKKHLAMVTPPGESYSIAEEPLDNPPADGV